MKRVMRWSAVVAMAVPIFFAGSAGAVPIFLGIDSSLSSITETGGGSAPLSGYLRIDVGSLPPNTETVTFDLLDVVADTDDLSIRLDPAFANPGLGVLNAAGAFLIPNLHVSLESAGQSTPLTLTGISGTFDPGDTCSTSFCLDVQFAITTGPGPSDSITVVVHAPEPSTAVLLLVGAALGCAVGRSRDSSPADPTLRTS